MLRDTYSKSSNAKRAAERAGLAVYTILQAGGGKWKIVQPPAAPPKAAATSKRAVALAAAASGVLPPAPDFTAATHAPYRKKLAALIALAEAGDAAGLEAVVINPSSTSPKALIRYRDRAALAIRTGVAK
jgi:hypothetical protein